MQQNKEESTVLEKNVYTVYTEDMKTRTDLTNYNIDKAKGRNENEKNKSCCIESRTAIFVHFFTLSVLGILIWGLLWSAFGDGWRWDGEWFRLAAVAIIAWASGQALQTLTTLPPLLAALLTGILARNLGILDMREYTHIDGFLRKIYPVIILGKASLGWDLNYMKCNWRQVAALGVLPWCAEVVTLAACTQLLLDFPWSWGFLLGSIYASVSCAVVMPTVQKHSATFPSTHTWPQLVCTAGGVDTALSVGVYGLIFTFMFHDSNDIYRYVKTGLTLFVGVALGVTWGSLAKLAPHSQDYYVAELRVLFVLVGGLCANFITSLFGWGGTAGVAVLVCNAIAANHWARDGWKLNKNPASTTYRVLWAALEPMVFAYTGTFFVVDASMSETMVLGFAILVICLTIRLTVTYFVCWNMTMREKIFVCCTWIPKSIVEAVLCPSAIDILLTSGSHSEHEIACAEKLMRLIVQAILVTTPIGFLLTNFLGTILLKESQKNCETGSSIQRTKSYSGSQNEDVTVQQY